ncbi:MAG: polysaccharide deacetylase family protein [Geobacter sp.]|nr:polysaccharide deacetylase family protein [Geobacter sp.]
MGFIRNIYHRLLLVPALPSIFSFARSSCATIFMMHRFTHKDRGIDGFDPEQLRKGLDYLRRNNYEFISLTELFARLNGNGVGLNGAVVFTIDDGYVDHAEIAAPIFAEYDCPVTTFATTGFLDGKLWMWWNKIEFIFKTSARQSVEIDIAGKKVLYNLNGNGNAMSVQDDFVERCKFLDNEDKLLLIASLAEKAEVILPDSPPVMYAPMTWGDARNCEKGGMTFGPHTVTHPILSRSTTEVAEWEITESWSRLCAELQNPVPVFCYPNGQFSDFGPREIGVFKKLGLSGAVVGAPGFADLQSKTDNDWSFKIRRFSFPEKLPALIQYVSGIERCKLMVRSRL